MQIQKIFGREVIEQAAIDQLQNCLVEGSIGVLSADAHKGYSMPIGGIIAYKDQISPSGVGFDIACGNKAVQTDIMYHDLGPNDVTHFMDEIARTISFGMGRPNNEKVDHEVFDLIAHSNFEPQRNLLKLAQDQLGTVGGGNHYVDLFAGDDGHVWIGVHFGSRGFGHKTASGFIAMSQGLKFDEHGKEGSMDAKPILFDEKSYIGQAYWEAMLVAGAYAYAGRNTVVNKVLSIIGGEALDSIHNHHNFAWKEMHNGELYTVVRKGATPAFPGQLGFIGSSMRDCSVIVEGIESETSAAGLYSTVHGAGRILSRTQAAGKKKWIRGEDGKKRPVKVAEGLINFDQVKKQMADANIVLRGAGADEAADCYKKLDEVLEYHAGTIKIKHVLRPIGVAMAGEETFDAYKD
jgi:tRNA-splicing ligase RtcB